MPVVLDRNMTINGNGARLDGSGGTGWTTGLTLSPGAENVTIQNLNIQNFTEGMRIESSGGCGVFNGVTVTACTIGLVLAESYQVDLDLSGSVISGCETGIKLCAGTSNCSLRNGSVTGNTADGIRLEGDPDSNRFDGIQITGNGGNGIVIYDGNENLITGCTVANNNVTGDAYGGIAVFSGCNVVVDTTIQGNQCFGIYADDALSTQPLVAVNNVWDDASGPSGVGPGSGDAVSENVVFTPWTGYVSTGDDDNDGWPNPAEEQAGTNPFDGSDFPTMTVFQVGGSGADDTNLGDAAHPLLTLHGAITRINGIVEGSYTVNLPAGTFNIAGGEADAAVTISQNVTIVGAGPGTTVIDGTGASTWTTGLLITSGAADVTIQGVSIRNFKKGIEVQSDGGCLKLLNSLISLSDIGLELAETYLLRRGSRRFQHSRMRHRHGAVCRYLQCGGPQRRHHAEHR